MGQESDFLSCRFSRRFEWTETEDGTILVLRPRFGEGAFGKKVAAFFGASGYRIRLDEIGSLVWRQCDGERTAAEIAQSLREAFGEKVEPAEKRLHTFILQMKRARMIKVEKAQSAGT